MRTAVVWVGGMVAALAIVACGGGTKVKVQPDATFTPPSGASIAPLSATASPAASPSSTPSPTPTVSAAQATDDAFKAGLTIFNAVSNDDCRTNNPQQKACLVEGVNQSSPDRGAAAFELGDPIAGGGATVVLGRDPQGQWGFWYGTQQEIFRTFDLPADMRVCGFGQGLQLRAEPSATSEALMSLSDGSTVRAEEFLLTAPGDYAGHTVGSGWYRVSAPVPGWVQSQLVADAKSGDCALHDAIEKGVG